MRINGHSAAVFGGASGLGAATARALHAAGAVVTIADLNGEQGTNLAAELGEKASFVEVDVRDTAQVEAAVTAASAAAAGGLRIAVCCAGIGWAEKTVGRDGPHQLKPFEQVVDVNLKGTFNALRWSAAAMAGNEPSESGERGVFIATASIAAFEGQMGQIAYAASKGGIVSMVLPAARDLAASGVRVNAIAPGLFDTPLLASLPQPARDSLAATIPFPPRFGKPEEFATLAVGIVENEMLNGAVLRIDGALRMAAR